MLCEEIGEEIHHRFPVFEHVGDARRRAAIILEHVEIIGADPHDVDADDMRIDAARRIEPHHFRHEGFILQDHVARDAPRPQDFLAMIDIVQESVERPHALFDPGRQPAPFGGGENARHDIEGDQPFRGLFGAIDRKGDALPAEQSFGLFEGSFDIGLGKLGHPLMDLRVGLAHLAVLQDHFIEKAASFSPHAAMRCCYRLLAIAT